MIGACPVPEAGGQGPLLPGEAGLLNECGCVRDAARDSSRRSSRETIRDRHRCQLRHDYYEW